MVEVATIPETVTQWLEPPRLLVEWSSPWEEFKSALRPALTRAPRRLAGEAPVGMFPYRGMLISWLLECLLLIAVIVIPEKFISLEIPLPPTHPERDVIYYSGNELPKTQDRGGAQSGKSGRAGGRQAHHRTQTIRVARGDQPRETVVDAPKLNLPHSDSAVANLLAFKPNPGPPPAEGLRSSLTAPILPAMSPVPPAPDVNSSARRTPNNLATSIVAPAPEVSRSSTRNSPALSAEIVPPTPNISRDKMRTANPIAPTVIAPAPRDAQRDLASSRIPLTQTVDVVAPPVSAPPRDVSSTSRLLLPAPAIVAPPPSQVSRDLNSWGSSATGDLRTNPVPPPPTASGGGSSGRLGGNGAGALTAQVVPPPASIGGQGSQGNSGGRAGQAAGSLLGSADVIPPPPGLGGGKALSGSGRGNKGTGAGGPLDLGSSVAPPSNAGGNAAGNGIIVSSQPGTQAGLPNSTGGGAIAMSPSGTAKTGLGGSGGGSGIGNGNGPGSGLHGEGSGAGKDNAGTGRGSNPNAQGGISPYPGSGGTGNGNNGTPAMPGVSVEGGTTTVTLPSFGVPGGDAPGTGPGHSSLNDHKRSGVTVIATSRSGGVLPYYGLLKGDNYSIYIETSLGTAVMQYSDPSSAKHPSREALSEPEPLRKDIPDGLRPTHVVFTCILDRTGVLKDLRVLDPGAAETTSKIMAALPKWKFRPAFRGEEPVEVTAIIGFGIDTR
ncbi:MAG TPA: hypothetical protein VJW96_09715 [Terriglobales bacterium]|jgi:hypothetical protein|nr:hypothetical protein [Terriglobales bacterium]